MSETSPAPASPEKTVVVTNPPSLCRLWTLTYLSLALNGVILLLLICAIIHGHHRKPPGYGGRDGGAYDERGPRGFGPSFQRFGGGFGPGPRWGQQGGMGMNRFGGGPGMMRGGPGGNGPGRPGMGGPGPMGGGPDTAPDPAKMTDNVLAMLTNKLTLTDDQKAKIKPIIQDQVAQMQKDMEAQREARPRSDRSLMPISRSSSMRLRFRVTNRQHQMMRSRGNNQLNF